jgi:hypothetical protein
MKKIGISASAFIVSFLVLFTPLAAADYCCPEMFEGLCPFVGLDVKAIRTAGKRDWRGDFPAVYAGGNAYFGFKFSENFGMEFGYQQTVRKSKKRAFGPATEFFNNNIRGSLSGLSYERHLTFKTWHANLNYYIALLRCFDFFASVGVGLIDPHMSISVNSVPPASVNAGFLPGALVRLHLAPRAIFRASTGLIMHVTDSFGIRGLIGYENTAHIAIKSDEVRTFLRRNIPIRVFRDSYSVSLGVFWKWP